MLNPDKGHLKVIADEYSGVNLAREAVMMAAITAAA